MKRFFGSAAFGMIVTLLLWLFLPKVEYLPWARSKPPAEDTASAPSVVDVPLPKQRFRNNEHPRLIAPECPSCDPYLYHGKFQQYQRSE